MRVFQHVEVQATLVSSPCEMAVAALVRHPSLLCFHGAKLEGGMTILTELMPTNLRTEVERGHCYPENRFSREHILSIAMDIACTQTQLPSPHNL